jgi:uncharacterized membrane protein
MIYAVALPLLYLPILFLVTRRRHAALIRVLGCCAAAVIPSAVIGVLFGAKGFFLLTPPALLLDAIFAVMGTVLALGYNLVERFSR